jgi:hypothetical protein
MITSMMYFFSIIAAACIAVAFAIAIASPFSTDRELIIRDWERRSPIALKWFIIAAANTFTAFLLRGLQ